MSLPEHESTPQTMNEDQLRTRLADARTEAQRHRDLAAYHHAEADELGHEIGELRAEIRRLCTS